MTRKCSRKRTRFEASWTSQRATRGRATISNTAVQDGFDVTLRRTSQPDFKAPGAALKARFCPAANSADASSPSRIDKVVDLLVRPQGHIVAALDIVESFFGGGAKPLDLGLVFPLALLQQAEALADHLACVTEATGGDASLDEAVKIFGEIDVAGWHDTPAAGVAIAEHDKGRYGQGRGPVRCS